MAYYTLIAFGYLFFWFNPAVRLLPWLALTSLILTGAAFLFSLYLTFIQTFALREWCTWCLCSAALCLIIFSLSLWTSPLNFADLLMQYQLPIFVIHLMALSIGVGGATISDILFLKFLKDFKISEDENTILKTVAQIIWLALAMLCLTGGSLYFPNMAALNHNSTFLLLSIIFVIIVINAGFLTLVVSPQLTRLSFANPAAKPVTYRRKLALALASISLVSWYSLLVLAIILNSNWPIPFSGLLWGYLAVLVVGLVLSQIVEWLVSHPYREGIVFDN